MGITKTAISIAIGMALIGILLNAPIVKGEVEEDKYEYVSIMDAIRIQHMASELWED